MPRFATVLLVDPLGRLLLQERDEHPAIDPECWGAPGGHVEDGEAVQDAAYRELAEETGLVLAPGALELFGEFDVWHEAYGSLDTVGLYVGSTSFTDEEVECREGRQMVFVDPEIAQALPLTGSASQTIPAFLASGAYPDARARAERTVRVAMVALVGPQGQILLQERDEHAPFDPDRWSFPGGGVEGGETYRQAALRELAEETGVRLDADDLQLVLRLSTVASATSLDCDVELWAARTELTDADVECHEGRQMVFVDTAAALELDLTHPTRLGLTDFLASDLYRKLATS